MSYSEEEGIVEVWCDHFDVVEWFGATFENYCSHTSVAAPTLLLATAQATRDGWDTVSTVTVLDGVPRKRVEHYCPAHAGGAS